MQLYTCGQRDRFGSVGHACGRAARALADAGHEVELVTVGGYKRVPFSRRHGERDEVRRLSGQDAVPLLVLDDGEAVVGSAAIVEWARANPAG